jgi:hypothetical protein
LASAKNSCAWPWVSKEREKFASFAIKERLSLPVIDQYLIVLIACAFIT